MLSPHTNREEAKSTEKGERGNSKVQLKSYFSPSDTSILSLMKPGFDGLWKTGICGIISPPLVWVHAMFMKSHVCKAYIYKQSKSQSLISVVEQRCCVVFSSISECHSKHLYISASQDTKWQGVLIILLTVPPYECWLVVSLVMLTYSSSSLPPMIYVLHYKKTRSPLSNLCLYGWCQSPS